MLFTLSAIIGSAILYGDFKTAKFHQIVTFLYGCATTFLGVFIIAWAPSSQDPDNPFEDVGDVDTADTHSTLTGRRRPGSVGAGRRQRGTILIPTGGSETPTTRSPIKAISFIGLSPAQVFFVINLALLIF